MTECKHLTPEGLCKKWGSPGRPCKPSTIEWCDDPVCIIDEDRMCRDSSIYGNTYSYITLEQIDDLMDGKVAMIDDGEYKHFICLKR